MKLALDKYVWKEKKMKQQEWDKTSMLKESLWQTGEHRQTKDDSLQLFHSSHKIYSGSVWKQSILFIVHQDLRLLSKTVKCILWQDPKYTAFQTALEEQWSYSLYENRNWHMIN